MMRYYFTLFVLAFCAVLHAQPNEVDLRSDDSGIRLAVDGQDFMINGMNWDYFPVGTNYNYSLWNQSDNFVQAALDAEMGLLKNMGVNAIRVYTGIPAKWITYIYENYGIYTMLNHSFGRYGLTIDGAWVGITDYANPKAQELLLAEVSAMATEYKNTPGLLLFLLGNENNYGLISGIRGANVGSIALYPNPAKDQITLDLTKISSGDQLQVQFIAVDGRVVAESSYSDFASKETIDVSSLCMGIYIVEIRTAEAKWLTKFIKE